MLWLLKYAQNAPALLVPWCGSSRPGKLRYLECSALGVILKECNRMVQEVSSRGVLTAALAVFLVLIMLGCTALSPQLIPRSAPPVSCVEGPRSIPEPRGSILEFVQEVLLMYGDLAVLRLQCREAILEEAGAK